MPLVRLYAVPEGYDPLPLAASLLTWLRGEKDLEARGGSLEGGYFLQARSKGGWRKFVGMEAALQVYLKMEGGRLSVMCGAARWTDKAAAGAAGVVLFPPLAVTAAFGAFSQAALIEEVFSFVSRETGVKGEPAPDPEEPPATPPPP